MEERRNAAVEVTNLSIPEGTVIGNTTFIQPELVLTSLDEQALLDFSSSFFSDEETDLFSIVRSMDNDLPDV